MFVFLFLFSLIASCAGTTPTPVEAPSLTAAVKTSQPSPENKSRAKNLKLLAELYKKLTSVSQHNPHFNKTKEYQECKKLILELYPHDKNSNIQNQTQKIFETYLNQLTQKKLNNLTSLEPEVIKITKKALAEIVKIRALTDLENCHVQDASRFILKIEKELLPEKALFAPFTFGLPELGYSATGVAAIVGIGSLMRNNRRTTNTFPKNGSQNKIGKEPEIIMRACPSQGSLGCSQHTSSNIYQIMTKIKQMNGAFSGYTFEEKKRFFLKTNFNFKTESEIRQEIHRMNNPCIKYGAHDSWKQYPLHLMAQYLNHPVCDHCQHSYTHINHNDVFCTFINEESRIEWCLIALDYLMSQIEKNIPLKTILENITSSEIPSDSQKEHLRALFCKDNKLKKTDTCPSPQGDPFLNAIRAFNQGKCLVLSTATATTATLNHMTTTIFLKSDGDTAGCIINLDSLWTSGDSRIHRYMKKLYSCFVKYKKCIDFIDANKKALFEEFKH